jgi:hypothetical protein
MTDSRSAGAAPSLEELQRKVQYALDHADSYGGMPAVHPDLLNAIAGYLRELAARRAPVADRDAAFVMAEMRRLAAQFADVSSERVTIMEGHALLERLANDLADALDLKNGVGPTVLTALARERDEWKAARFRDVALANRRIAALEEDARKWAWYRKRHGQMPGEETADEWAEEQALEEKQRAWLASRAGPEPRE